MPTKCHLYPPRVKINFAGKTGSVVLDQIRAIDKKRVVKKLGKLKAKEIDAVKKTIMEMLVE